MPRNIELKFTYPSLEQADQIARGIDAVLTGCERQIDSYFALARTHHDSADQVPTRLKLRQITALSGPKSPPRSQLIYYTRANSSAPSASDYLLVDVPDGDTMLAILDASMSRTQQVCKTRSIFIWDDVRIHLDEVLELGQFMEFEAIVNDRCSDEQADLKVRHLIRSFKIDPAWLICSSYTDLLAERLKKKE